jgi:hypothetical protein
MNYGRKKFYSTGPWSQCCETIWAVVQVQRLYDHIWPFWHHDIQHNNTPHNDTQHNQARCPILLLLS